MATPSATWTTKSNQQMSIEQLIEQYAASDAAKFSVLFRRLRGNYAQDCVRGCIRHLARHSTGGQASRQMLLWLTSTPDYMKEILDARLVSAAEARRAALALRDADVQFYTKLARYLQCPKTSKPLNSVERVLELIPFLGECGVLIPWLRSLSEHANENIRLAAAKVLCEMRPTRAMVERQLQCGEPQARANAVEALWRQPGPDARVVFRIALGDSDHRVVAKALYGLHLNNDRTAVGKMIEMAAHRSPSARLAVLAEMTKTSDPRCVMTIRMLTGDQDGVVRKAAQRAVSNLSADAEQDVALSAHGVAAKAAAASATRAGNPNTEKSAKETNSAESSAFRFPVLHLLS